MAGTHPDHSDDLRGKLVGWILLLGSLQFVVEMGVEEAIFPTKYSLVSNAISDLGGYDAGGLRWAFDISVFLVGVAALLAALLLWTLLPRRRSLRVGVVFLMIAGVGAMIVGLYPEYTHAPHAVGAILAFLFGNLGLMALGRGFRKTGEDLGFARLTWALGLFGLLSIFVALAAGALIQQSVFGITERMIVAPVLVWSVVYGVRLLRGTARLSGSQGVPLSPRVNAGRPPEGLRMV